MQTSINGEQIDVVSVYDRGLSYGDGVFETICLKHGAPVLLAEHLQRLQSSCQRLQINLDLQTLIGELDNFLASCPTHGVIKIIITRGVGGRGYQPDPQSNSSRLIQYFPMPDYPASFSSQGISVQVCRHRLGSNPQLAGIKHLNRLDQVLAANELGSEFPEGLCLDGADNVVEGTKCNLLVVLGDELITPELNQCGVQGVMLDYLSRKFSAAGLSPKLKHINLQDLRRASEVFLCNSVIGVWPVVKMHEDGKVFEWAVGPTARQAIGYQNEIFNSTAPH